MRTAVVLTLVVPAFSFAAEFAEPVLLEAGGAPIKVDAPGYACPSWADWDGDGKNDLLVGQFAKGNIRFFKNEGGDGLPKLRKGEMLMAGKDPAEVPGVW
jgi:hypothetical protein